MTRIATGIARGWAEDEIHRAVMAGIPREFRHADEHARRELLEKRPEETGTRWDGVLAAVVEHLAGLHGYPAPEWVNEPARFWTPPAALDTFGCQSTSTIRGNLAECPGAFIRHGIIADARDLDERGGELVVWNGE